MEVKYVSQERVERRTYIDLRVAIPASKIALKVETALYPTRGVKAMANNSEAGQ